jgi:hypothetical protein
VAELVETKTRTGGYDQTMRIYKYKDSFGRTFTYVNDGVSYYQGRTYSCSEDLEGTWKRPKKLDRNSPYLTPDGEREVEIIDTDHDPGYEFYEPVQVEVPAKEFYKNRVQ